MHQIIVKLNVITPIKVQYVIFVVFFSGLRLYTDTYQKFIENKK